MDFPGGSDGKASAYNAGDPGSIPGSGRSPGERNGNPLQYSCLENPMDREAWWATGHGVTKSRTWLSDFTVTVFHFCMSIILQKERARGREGRRRGKKGTFGEGGLLGKMKQLHKFQQDSTRPLAILMLWFKEPVLSWRNVWGWRIIRSLLLDVK